MVNVVRAGMAVSRQDRDDNLAPVGGTASNMFTDRNVEHDRIQFRHEALKALVPIGAHAMKIELPNGQLLMGSRDTHAETVLQVRLPDTDGGLVRASLTIQVIPHVQVLADLVRSVMTRHS